MSETKGDTSKGHGNGGAPASVDFHYIKANDFHVVHADGVWGGVTPRGYITMSFFSERHPIPIKLTNKLDANKQLGAEIGRESKSGIIREVNVEVIMDVPMAKSFRNWLNEKIEICEQQEIRKEEK